MSNTTISESVKNYYGQVLKSSKDLKTSACCTLDTMPPYMRPFLADLHPDVVARYYGCGLPLPTALEGRTVLDLGCGSGRDCYLLSRLVGETGQVIGVDMTQAQIAVAKQHQDWHTQRYGYVQSNVKFVQGYIEDLATAGILDNSIDVVVSNCVVNLSPDKERVLAEILRVLKPGGEIYFADVYADRRIPQALKMEPVLLGECLGGALYWQDFCRIMHRLGCLDVRVIKETPIILKDTEVIAKIGMVNFVSVTVRAFKIPLESLCEDFGQLATYKGTITECPHAFDLDNHHHFETDKPLRICGNSADMLGLSRYSKHFDIVGNKSTHFGLFACGADNATSAESGLTCC